VFKSFLLQKQIEFELLCSSILQVEAGY